MQRQSRSTTLRAWWPAFVTLAAVSLAAPSHARVDRSGKDVVDAVCAACHAGGKDNAPRIGDAKAWGARASQGLTALTEHAIHGIRKMPAHGGSAGVSDVEIARAIAYMVNQSGGHWVEPAGARAVRTSDAIVQTQCAKCHASGVDGAPRIGDRAAWIPRLQKGLDATVASAIHGHGPMPARGGMPELSEQEIRGAIAYMFNVGLPPAAPVAPAAQTPDARHRIVGGTDVYLGMMRAEAVRAAKADVPAGKGYYHVNISLSDHKSHAPVTDAHVKLRVSDGVSAESKALGLVAVNNAVSYGGYFRFASGSAYHITAEIQRPGVAGTLEAKFEFRAP